MIFIGDDWAEAHHDVYLMDEAGQRLASRRLPEGLAGIRELHELIAAHVQEPNQVVIGIETDRGLWVGALSAAGYQVYRGQSDGGGPLSRPPPRLGRQIRCLRCQTAGRSGAHRPAQPPPDRRRQPPGGRDQGTGPGSSELDLGTHPAHQRAAPRCASTTRPRWRRSRTWPTAMRWGCSIAHPPPSRVLICPCRHPVRAQTWWAATQYRRPRPRDPVRATVRTADRTREGHGGVRGHHPREQYAEGYDRRDIPAAYSSCGRVPAAMRSHTWMGQVCSREAPKGAVAVRPTPKVSATFSCVRPS